jgi:hypothetical protein
MKKLLILLPVLIMAMFALGGCANTSANADDGTNTSKSTKSVSDCGDRGIDRESMLAWKNCMKELRN